LALNGSEVVMSVSDVQRLMVIDVLSMASVR